jgi:hypothetical protein
MAERDRGNHEREESHGTGYGTERSVYEEFLARKWEGSALPSPQAYAQAIGLWRQLPGSIMTAPSDLGTIPEPAPGDDPNDSSQKSGADDERDRS